MTGDKPRFPNTSNDGIAGGLLVDGNFADSLTLNFNLNF